MTASMTLEPCPFCGAALSLRSPGMNPFGRCDTAGCWMRERSYAVVLDDPAQVRQWNTRATADAIETAEKALERSAKAGERVLAAMDAYNEKHGTHLVGSAFFEIGRAVAQNRAALAKLRDNR